MNLNDFKTRYQALQQSVEADFLKDPDSAEALVLARSDGVDELLEDIWQSFKMGNDLCLVAVGGYGRSELHLYSDVDLLILIPNESHDTYQEDISNFLTFLWDVGLEVGHATRDIQDCIYAIDDLSVVTNLLESRLLIGNNSLFLKMKSMIKASNWSSQSFFVEKQKEQHNRHLNFSNTAYNLEPNVKESPGGLRDIQTITWVAKWYFDVNFLSDLVDKNYLTENEYALLKQGQLFLWKVRFALHIIAKHREDRLAFQYQKQIATILGYTDGDRMAVESLMKDYYQTVTKVSRLNDILLQLLEDRVLHTQNLNERFNINYGYIQTNNDQVFVKTPSAFIEIFLLIAKHNYIRGISASTLRQMQFSLNIIDKDYHKKRNNNRLFIELLQQKQGVNKALKLMNRYGILEHYIPAFGKIIGLMQYDLFHAYTVDQHTLFVIRNLRRFFVPDFSKEFELCSEIAQNIQKPELLLLAGLFHDIAKGRGGDHAQLGSKEARDFCKHHQLKAQEIDLVAGLVEKHLLMSKTAQKKNIDDFEVIDEFSEAVGSVKFLEFLYLLTVADIRSTKADLWNDWKDSLLKKLFYKTKDHLQSGKAEPPEINQQIKTIKQSVSIEAQRQGYEANEIEYLFTTLPKDYFLRYEIDDILWHLGVVIRCQDRAVAVASKISEYNVVDVFVYSKDSKGLFFRLVSIIEKFGLDIVDAKILTTKDHKAYNTISILQDKVFEQIDINQEIESELGRSSEGVEEVGAKLSHRYFDYKMKINFSINKKWNLTQLEISVIDKQGLLSNIAYIFFQLNISLINARIATLGERVEDLFFISNSQNKPLSKDEERALQIALEERL